MIKMHPGLLVRELLEESLDVDCIENFLEGREDVTEDVAINLEGLFGNSREYWMEMQKNFDSNQ